MDDFIMSFATVAAARPLASYLRTFLQHGGFRLTKFVTYHPAALTVFPEEDKGIVRTQRKSSVKLGVFRMTRSQLQRRKQSTRRKRFHNYSAWFPPFLILLVCSLLSGYNSKSFFNFSKPLEARTTLGTSPFLMISYLASTSSLRNMPPCLTSPY